jgi:hypothetical protein
MSDEVLYGLRAANVMLGLAGALWLGIRSAIRYKQYPPIVNLFILTIVMYALAVTTAQIISITYSEGEIPTGPQFARAILFLMANLTLLVTLALSQNKREISVRHREHR